jgi:hypothetical protein
MHMGPKEALVTLLYRGGAPKDIGHGFSEVSKDIESMLAASDPRAHLIVRAQDDNEDATHFEWIGRCGAYGYHLEIMLLDRYACVEPLDVMATEEVAVIIDRLKSKPFLGV